MCVYSAQIYSKTWIIFGHGSQKCLISTKIWLELLPTTTFSKWNQNQASLFFAQPANSTNWATRSRAVREMNELKFVLILIFLISDPISTFAQI